MEWFFVSSGEKTSDDDINSTPAKQSFPSYFIILLLLMCSFELQSHTLISHRSVRVYTVFQCMNELIRLNFFEIFRVCMHKLADSSETKYRRKKTFAKIHDHLSKYFMQILLPQIEMIRLSDVLFFLIHVWFGC